MMKAEAIRRAVGEVNPIKTRLLDCCRMMDQAGARREAESLDRVIARLEQWQARVS